MSKRNATLDQKSCTIMRKGCVRKSGDKLVRSGHGVTESTGKLCIIVSLRSQNLKSREQEHGVEDIERKDNRKARQG